MPTFEHDDFAAGLDLRFGAYGHKGSHAFATLDNYYVDSGKKLNRRSPIIAAGVFGAGTYGLITINGVLTTLKASGTAPALPAGVSALAFDVPYGATVHALKDLATIGDTPVAVIAHTIAGVVRYFLHVFDAAADQFTYVLDPSFPWMHELDPTVSPVMTCAVAKVWVSDKVGDVAHSAVNKPRVWNTLDRDGFLARGHEFHVYATAAGAQTFTIPLNYYNIDPLWGGGLTQGFLGWVVEQYTGTGTPSYTPDANWTTRLVEVAAGPAASQCSFASTANTSTGATYANWIAVTINAPGAGWFRVRFMPPRDGVSRQVNNYVVSGLWNPTIFTPPVVGLEIYLRGDGVSKQFQIPSMSYQDPAVYTYAVQVDAVVKARPADYDVVAGPNGQLQLNMVAAPADGSLIYLRQNTDTGVRVIVSPGVVNTLQGERTYAGGNVACTAALGYHHIFLDLSTDGVPSSLSEVVPGGFISGKRIYESVYLGKVQRTGANAYYVPVYTSVRYPNPSIYSTTFFMYRDKVADLQLYNAVGSLFGFGDAGFIPASKDDLSGGPVTMLGATRDRLLVSYARGSLLWSIYINPARDVLAYSSPVGTDGQTHPYPVDFFGALIAPTARGIRLFDLEATTLTDTLDDKNLGSPIDGLGAAQVLAGTFFPHLSQYVAAATIGGVFSFLVFSYHQQEKVSAWSRYPAPAGITTVDYRGMVPLGTKLYFRSGNSLYYFNGAAVIGTANTFRDDNDVVGTPFSSIAEPLLNHLGRPSTLKQYQRLRLGQTGRSTVTFRRMVNGAAVYQAGPTISGENISKPACRLAMRAIAIAPRITSVDLTGHRLESYSYDYAHLGRA